MRFRQILIFRIFNSLPSLRSSLVPSRALWWVDKSSQMESICYIIQTTVKDVCLLESKVANQSFLAIPIHRQYRNNRKDFPYPIWLICSMWFMAPWQVREEVEGNSVIHTWSWIIRQIYSYCVNYSHHNVKKDPFKVNTSNLLNLSRIILQRQSTYPMIKLLRVAS